MWSWRDRYLGGVLLAVAAALEHHLEGDPEQEQPAGDPERRQADAEKPQQHLAAEAEEGEDAKRDQRRPRRDAPALLRRHAAGDRQEDRREPRRVDRDEKRHQRGGEKIGIHQGKPNRVSAPAEERPRSAGPLEGD